MQGLIWWCCWFFFFFFCIEVFKFSKSFPHATSGKEPTCQCRRCKRYGFDPWVGKIPGGGNGKLLQYSGLENLRDRVAWWTIVLGVTKSWTQLKRLSTFKILVPLGVLPHVACRTVAPPSGTESTSPVLESGILTTGPPGKSLHVNCKSHLLWRYDYSFICIFSVCCLSLSDYLCWISTLSSSKTIKKKTPNLHCTKL